MNSNQISRSNSSSKFSSSGGTQSRAKNMELEKDLLNQDLLASVNINNLHQLNQEDSNLAHKGVSTDFNIMVCGGTGIGKSSFVDLFLKKFNYSEATKIIESEEFESLNKEVIKRATETFEEKTLNSLSTKNSP